MDNTGQYVTYADLILELFEGDSLKVTNSVITLSNKTVDPGGDIFEFSVVGGQPIPAIGDVVTQAGFTDCIIAVLTSPDRIRVEKTGAESLIVDGAATLLKSIKVTKARGLKLIQEAMDFIDLHTGRFFNKRTGTFRIEGNNTIMLMFNVPIIEITKLLINNTDLELIEGDDNDFITFKGRQEPEDDRWNPKLKLNVRQDSIFSGVLTNRVFLREVITILEGSFGFLELDGSTPLLIQKATKMIVLENINNPRGADGEGETRGTVRRLKVDLHEQEFFEVRNQSRGNPLTINSEVNNIIAKYKSPLNIGGSFRVLRNLSD